MEQRIIVFAVVPRTNFSSRVVVVVVVVLGGGRACTLYLTRRRGRSQSKDIQVVFRVFINPKHVGVFFLVFLSIER